MVLRVGIVIWCWTWKVWNHRILLWWVIIANDSSMSLSSIRIGSKEIGKFGATLNKKQIQLPLCSVFWDSYLLSLWLLLNKKAQDSTMMWEMPYFGLLLLWSKAFLFFFFFFCRKVPWKLSRCWLIFKQRSFKLLLAWRSVFPVHELSYTYRVLHGKNLFA